MAIIKVFAAYYRFPMDVAILAFRISTIKLYCGTHKCTLTLHFVQWLSLQNDFGNALCGLLRG